MVYLEADKVIYSFSSKHKPAVEVDSGERIEIGVRDAYDRFFQRLPNIKQYLLYNEKSLSNPATGPIFIRGIKPGDGLDVIIEKVNLSHTGYIAAVKGRGVLSDTDIEPHLSTFSVKQDGLWYQDKIRLRLRPMVGVIGVTPSDFDVLTVDLGYHGGNLDCNDITAGTTVHFPVYLPGALLAVGDVHASMGFGEVYSGVNIEASVIIRVERVPKPGWERPWFETASEIMTLGVEDNLEDAIREAALSMTKLLQYHFTISYSEAISLTGAACDIRLGQASKFGTKVSAYAVFPKASLF
ncbi:MAG: acetamidase/formamidase family protein [Spirochaetota bacterium]